MFFDRNGNPTDDADRDCAGAMCEFGPGDDYDVMNSRDYEDPLAPDRENKPYGWGIEEFEDPALAAANVAMWAEVHKRNLNTYTSAGSYLETWGIFAGGPKGLTISDADRGYRDFCWRVRSKWDRKLWECSERLWGRLCDRCETHAEAVKRYTAWAEKRTGEVKTGRSWN